MSEIKEEDDLAGVDVEDAVAPAEKTTNITRAAILMLGGNKGGDARDILEPFDFWRITTNVEEIAKARAHHLIFGETDEEIAQKVERRYPTLHANHSLVHYEERELRVSREAMTGHWGRNHGCKYKKIYAEGWRVLKSPMYTGEVAGEQHLLNLCISNRSIILKATAIEILGGKRELEKRMFCAQGAGHPSLLRIRWNPLFHRNREYRRAVATVKARTADRLPQDLLGMLGDCLNPTHWPDSHPFKGLFHGVQGKARGGGWHRTYHDPYGYCIDDVVRYIKLNLRVTPSLRPWRQAETHEQNKNGYGGNTLKFRAILDACLDHLHGIRKNKDEDYVFLRRWLIAEARAVGLAIPAPLRMPKAPRLPKVRGTRRGQHPLHPTTPAAGATAEAHSQPVHQIVVGEVPVRAAA